jgi:hypothetical protein
VVTGPTGRVLAAASRGRHAASPAGRCVARALRAARFSASAKPRQILYLAVVLR